MRIKLMTDIHDQYIRSISSLEFFFQFSDILIGINVFYASYYPPPENIRSTASSTSA